MTRSAASPSRTTSPAASVTFSRPRPAYGVYNLTGAGAPTTWAEVARLVYELTGHDPERVTGVSTEEYFSAATGPVAPRPLNSVLDLSKLEAAGFRPETAREALERYLAA